MIEIIPITKEDELFTDGLTTEQIKQITVSNYCYSIDLDLISKLMSIEDRPIKNQKIFIRNILKFLNYLDVVYITEKKETISSRIFIEHFTWKHYIRYKEILSELEIITKVPHRDGTWYVEGQYSMKYRIHNKYLKLDNLCLVVIGEGRKKYERPFFIDDRLDLDQRFIDTISKVEINVVNAIEAEIDNYVDRNIKLRYSKKKPLPLNILRNRLNRLFYLKQKRFIKKGNKVERVYHSFTNLTKVSRKHLNIRFNSMDIKNSQPLILVSHLKRNNLDMDDNYQQDCEDANFYERFYDLYPTITYEKELRDKIKGQILSTLFFGFFDSPINRRFKELYPLTWESLKTISETDISLASVLQDLEASLFNNLIPKKSKYYFTLFDAIYFSDTRDIPDIDRRITDFFNNLGVKVKVEIE